jgi:RNA polymerase sigma-70 factor (ECF subfamily)
MEEVSTDRVTALRPVDFEVFYRGAWDDVYRAVWVTFRDADLACEAVDEAMVRAFQHWSKVAGYQNPRGWVYRVAVNWAKNRLKRTGHERRWLATERPDGVEEVAVTNTAEAVRVLPLGQRQVVVLRLLMDWSEAETAAALGVPVGTVKSRLNRALVRLREEQQ